MCSARLSLALWVFILYSYLFQTVSKIYFLYSNTSPGWQSSALQIFSRVSNRTALAFPFFKIERFAIVIPTFSVSSVMLIFRFASITSMLIIIAIY